MLVHIWAFQVWFQCVRFQALQLPSLDYFFALVWNSFGVSVAKNFAIKLTGILVYHSDNRGGWICVATEGCWSSPRSPQLVQNLFEVQHSSHVSIEHTVLAIGQHTCLICASQQSMAQHRRSLSSSVWSWVGDSSEWLQTCLLTTWAYLGRPKFINQ